MTSPWLQRKIRPFIQFLQHSTDRVWYPPLLGFLAAIDYLVIVIPTDGILISSSMLTPKRWLVFALTATIGSTIGAVGLAALVEFLGLPWILEFYPGIAQTKTWLLTIQFFEEYGLLLVFFVAATPLMQHPAVILASLANTPLPTLAIVILIGRLIKNLVMAYVGSHTPRLLKRMWGLRGEMDDAGINIS